MSDPLVGSAHPTQEKIMTRLIAAFAVFALTSIALGDVIVFQPGGEAPKFNPSYDNLYRPGNPIWELRQIRMAAGDAVDPRSEYPLLDTMSSSTVSSAVVARPLTVFEAENATYTAYNYRMSDLMRSTQTVTVEEQNDNPVFLGMRPGEPAEPNRHIVINQINPKGADENPARPGEVIIKPYQAPARTRAVR